MIRPGSILRAAAAAALAGPIVLATLAPAHSQKIDARRLAQERAAHIRDMLQFVALGIRRGGALSVGKIEASADRGLVRIHNLVMVLRRYPLVFSIKLIEIHDFDRRHLLPHKMKVAAYDLEAEMGTIPQILRGLMLALGVRHTRGSLSLDYAYNARKSIFALDSLKVQWSGYAAAKLSGNFENVPNPNTVLGLATSPGSATARLEAIRIKDWRLTVFNKAAQDVFFKSAAFIRKEDYDTFKNKTLALLEQRAKRSSTRLERDFWEAARTVISGTSVATANGVASRAVPISAVQALQNAKQGEKLFRIRFDAKTVSAETIDKEMAEPKLAPWNAKAATITNPPVHECDRVAAAPDDAKRKATPVSDGAFDRIVALAACKRAVMEYPAAPRFQFEYGRALEAAEHRGLARQYLRKASDAGYAAATLHLGRSYVGPATSSPDPAQALDLYRKAEQQGSPAAKIEIARAYLFGQGVEKDVEPAKKVVRDDALANRPLGKELLADMYWNGWGEERDRKRALTLYEDAAQGGLARAQMRLVEIYANGSQGVKADPAKAYFWLRILARQGLKKFVRKQSAVIRKLDHDARRRIDEKARDWLPRGA
jgi:hypothetical protein